MKVEYRNLRRTSTKRKYNKEPSRDEEYGNLNEKIH